jgi:hypothetical protein
VIAMAGSETCGIVRALALIGLAALATAGAPGVVWAAEAAGQQRDTQDAGAAPVRTAKERLSGKSADEQRVDNCKVPLELRGPKPRPDDCSAGRARPR